MKAMILKSPNSIYKNPLEFADIPIPEPNDNEIRIKVKYCGICHTDLHIVEGELPLVKTPIIPGHQIVGTVDKAGNLVNRFKQGDIVGVAWLGQTCGECIYCKNESENLCENAKFTGYHNDGGYAEYSIVHQDFAYYIPTNFPLDMVAPLLCAGIIGYRALKLSEIKKGGKLGLYGFGASAHIAIQVARYWNCKVYVFSRSDKHSELAKKLGAVWVGNAKNPPNEKLDSAIIFAPAGELVKSALESLDRGGTLSLAGIYMTPIPELDYEKHLYYEKKITSVTASTRKDGEELLKLASEIPIKTEVQVFNLDEANIALQLLKDGKINGAGVLKI